MGGADVGVPHELAYTIFVYTGDMRGAETDANVFIELQGRSGTSCDPTAAQPHSHSTATPAQPLRT